MPAIAPSLLDASAILARHAAHLARLPLTPAGLELTRRALVGDPARAVRGGQANVISRTAFRRFGLTNDTESITLEFEHLHILNASVAVLDVRTQAVTLTVHPVEPVEGGAPRRRGWQIYPDFLVIEQGRVVLQDLMREKELVMHAATRPWYIAKDLASGRWTCPSAMAAAAELGMEYEIISDAEHSRKLARNCRYLADFAAEPPSEATAQLVAAEVAATPGITVAELIAAGGDGRWGADAVLTAIAQNGIYCDLTQHIVDDQGHARLYADAVIARAYAAAHPPSWAVVARRPQVASVTPGTRYSLGGQALEVFVSSGPVVHLRATNVPGCPMMSLERTEFDRLFERGDLVPDRTAATADDLARQAVLAAWQAASTGDRLTAEARWRALEVWHANATAERARRPLLPAPLVDGAVPGMRSLQRWDRSSKASDRAFGDHLIGLLPKPRRGRPGPRLAVRVEQLIETTLREYYAQPIGRSKKSVIAKIRLMCRTENVVDVPDRKSIRVRIARMDRYATRLAREGSKGAYADKPYLPTDSDATPVFGLYPFQRVHYDTTTLDVEAVDAQSGRNLGRPTLGYLIDGYSDRELARGWTFGGPTGAHVLDCLVACAERFGRLPEELILDNASAHLKVALLVFSAAHAMTITYRPKSQGRFGGPVELAFARITNALIHQLRGNTRAMKNVRAVTDAVNARRTAVLSLPEIDELMDVWVEKVENVRIVARLGKTVATAFEDGLVAHGTRATRSVVVDEAFRMQTLVPVGTRVAQGVTGVSVGYIAYQHECFTHSGVRGETLEVGLDDRNVTVAYALVPAHYHGAERVEAGWVTATARVFRHFRVVSHAELVLATKTIRERYRDDARTQVAREIAIAEVLERADEIEELALERRQQAACREIRPDFASAAARRAPVGGAGSPSVAVPADPLGGFDIDPFDAIASQIGDGYLHLHQERT